MSAYSTVRITRSRAIQMYLDHVKIDLTNEQLSDILDDIGSKILLNYIVVDDDSDNDDDGFNF